MSDLPTQKATVPDAETKLAVERTHLAYDRTMLSWVRTATALITFGFSIHQFFRIASKGTVERTGLIGPHEFGMLMIVIGLVALLLATLEHRSAIHALQAQYPETKPYGFAATVSSASATPLNPALTVIGFRRCHSRRIIILAI